MRDLPNMAEKERGIAAEPSLGITRTASVAGSSSSTASPITSMSAGSSQDSLGQSTGAQATTTANAAANSAAAQPQNQPQQSANKALSWGQVLWDKWHWGLLLAVALVVSRFSST